jgi:hypothetical protein
VEEWGLHPRGATSRSHDPMNGPDEPPAATCYLCSSLSTEGLRNCDLCHRPVCKSCAIGWPMDDLAIKWRRASCGPSVDRGARRIVAEVREMLRRGWRAWSLPRGSRTSGCSSRTPGLGRPHWADGHRLSAGDTGTVAGGPPCRVPPSAH